MKTTLSDSRTFIIENRIDAKNILVVLKGHNKYQDYEMPIIDSEKNPLIFLQDVEKTNSKSHKNLAKCRRHNLCIT